MTEREDILAAIRDARGNISKAARRLGVARRTLQKRMRLYSIPKGQAGRKKRKIRYGGIPRSVGKAAVAVGAVAAVGLLYAKARGDAKKG